MKIVPIFVDEESNEGIWSIYLDHETETEFDRLLDYVNDPEWLFNFFEVNNLDLIDGYWKETDVESAILKTIHEANIIEDVLYNYAEKGFASKEMALQHLFKPLNNYEYAIIVHQKSKARIRNGWLRLYGIRLSANCYLITGGSIKLTGNMERPHLQNELQKIDQVRTFLQKNGIDYPEDLNTFDNE